MKKALVGHVLRSGLRASERRRAPRNLRPQPAVERAAPRPTAAGTPWCSISPLPPSRLAPAAGAACSGGLLRSREGQSLGAPALPAPGLVWGVFLMQQDRRFLFLSLRNAVLLGEQKKRADVLEVKLASKQSGRARNRATSVGFGVKWQMGKV